jgi:hypothetical protein
MATRAGALRGPGEQTLHAQRDYRRSRRGPAARRAFGLAASIRWSGPGIVLVVAGGQGFKSQGSRVTMILLNANHLAVVHKLVLAQRAPMLTKTSHG